MMSDCLHVVTVTLEVRVQNERLSRTTERVARILNDALGEQIVSMKAESVDCLEPLR